jgi:hypothetical protein
MLKGAAGSIAATGLCWVVCMLVVVAVMDGIGASEHVKTYSEQALISSALWDVPGAWVLTIALVLIGMWTAVGFVAPLVMTGRGWLLALVYTGLLCLMIAHVLIVDWLEKRRVVNAAYWINSTLLGLAVLLVVAAFVAAWRKRLIGGRELLFAGGVWLAVLLLVELPLHLKGGLEYFFMPYYVDFVWPFIAVLPLFPLAAAPLAIHWNRHR